VIDYTIIEAISLVSRNTETDKFYLTINKVFLLEERKHSSDVDRETNFDFNSYQQ